MTDNDIEDIQTVDIKVTAESIDAHVMCLKESAWTKYLLAFLMGGYIIGVVL